jgi:DNA repair photolyase
MVVERGQRKGPILTPSSLPCLGNTPTINITDGCAHGCLYCYTQSYSCYPGKGRVIIFDNIPELVRSELARKRHRPKRVYFSPSSDAFQPLPEVQDVTYKTMSILLKAGVEIAFLSKGSIQERFLALFSEFPAKVFAQIGITTVDERLQNALEPGAALPSQRLEAIENLTRIGIPVRARLDPLVPDLTDTDENLVALMAELEKRQVRSIAASYLFLRPAFAQQLFETLRPCAVEVNPAQTWSWHRLADGVGGGQMIALADRQDRFARLGTLAAKHGMELHVCACKNPDLVLKSDCRIAGPAPNPIGDGPLFKAAGLDQEIQS